MRVVLGSEKGSVPSQEHLAVQQNFLWPKGHAGCLVSVLRQLQLDRARRDMYTLFPGSSNPPFPPYFGNCLDFYSKVPMRPGFFPPLGNAGDLEPRS